MAGTTAGNSDLISVQLSSAIFAKARFSDRTLLRSAASGRSLLISSGARAAHFQGHQKCEE